MSSCPRIGLEATVHSISQGGYGIISEDFKDMMDKVRKEAPTCKEIKALMGKVETEGTDVCSTSCT